MLYVQSCFISRFRFNSRIDTVFLSPLLLSPVDKEGWLLKKAPDAPSHGRGFQKRYFSLKGNLLFYFDKKGDKEPLGVIIMEGCTVELVEVPDQAYTFGIHFQVLIELIRCIA